MQLPAVAFSNFPFLDFILMRASLLREAVRLISNLDWDYEGKATV